jgi:predicted O-methyltransferase YrrM
MNSRSAQDLPHSDPTLIFELFRGSYATELLTSAVAHFQLFEKLAAGGKSATALAAELHLARRPAVVLFTALKAMGLLTATGDELSLTPLAREHLLRDTPFFVGDYLGLAADSPGVVEMTTRLKTNRPAGADDAAGAAFIFRDGVESAMEQEKSARHFTLALAGRAKNVAPALAAAVPLSDVRTLLDLGGGTGIYSIAWLQKHPSLRAIVFDRPEVLKIAAEFAADYGVAQRLETVAGDMFRDELPTGCDAILLSNILHDWDEPECQQLIHRCAAALPPGGRLLIHDVFLNDNLDGPLPIALYSAALFGFTEGRAYSAAEYRQWLSAAGLQAGEIVPTLIHCGCLVGVKRG